MMVEYLDIGWVLFLNYYLSGVFLFAMMWLTRVRFIFAFLAIMVSFGSAMLAVSIYAGWL